MKTQVDLAVIKEQLMNNTREHQEIKTEISEVKVSVKEINGKLDKAIIEKADKETVNTLENRIWYLVVGFLMLLAGIIAAWFKR